MSAVIPGDRIVGAYLRRLPREMGQNSFASPAFLFEAQERERIALGVMRRCRAFPLARKRVLVFESSNGRWVRDLLRWGADPEKIFSVQHYETAKLEFADGSFDVVFQGGLMSTVLDTAVRRSMAAEMQRVLRPGGALVWFDARSNNPKNPDVRGVPRREIEGLFGGWRLRLKRALPPIQVFRTLAPVSWVAAYLVSRIPFVGSNNVGVIQKRR